MRHSDPWTDINDDWFAALVNERGETYGLARRIHADGGIRYETWTGAAWQFTTEGAGYFTGAGGVTDAVPIDPAEAGRVLASLTIHGNPAGHGEGGLDRSIASGAERQGLEARPKHLWSDPTRPWYAALVVSARQPPYGLVRRIPGPGGVAYHYWDRRAGCWMPARDPLAIFSGEGGVNDAEPVDQETAWQILRALGGTELLTERERLLDDLQILGQPTEASLLAVLNRVNVWMTDHPDDLEVAGTAELAGKLLSAFELGLLGGDGE